MNLYFDKILKSAKRTYRKNFEIEDDLYTELEQLSTYYNTSIANLVNICISALIQTEDIVLYRNVQVPTVKHTFYIKGKNLDGLEKLRDTYRISLYRLVNIAIGNILNQSDKTELR